PPPSSVAAGGPFGFVVDAVDHYGNLDTTFGGDVTIGLVASPGVQLHGSPKTTAVGGIAPFSGLSIDTAGTYTIQAGSGSLFVATTAPITVPAGPLSALIVTVQPTGTVQAGGTFGLSVGGADGYGNPISSFSGTVTIGLANSPGVTLNGANPEPAQ